MTQRLSDFGRIGLMEQRRKWSEKVLDDAQSRNDEAVKRKVRELACFNQPNHPSAGNQPGGERGDEANGQRDFLTFGAQGRAVFERT